MVLRTSRAHKHYIMYLLNSPLNRMQSGKTSTWRRTYIHNLEVPSQFTTHTRTAIQIEICNVLFTIESTYNH